jgi:Tfp pilus assembly protein PilP
VAVPASGQEPSGPVVPPRASATAPPAYAYTPDTRRDPFVSLLRRGPEIPRRSDGKPLDGVRGLLVNEIALKGILQSRSDSIALVQGPDSKTYLVRVNDRFLDGFVRAVTSDTLILMQDVSDPLSVTKQREVRKTLRAMVEQK